MEIFGRGEGRRAKEGNATAVFALPPLFCVGELRDEMTHFGHFTPLHFLSGEAISDAERADRVMLLALLRNGVRRRRVVVF